MKTSGDIKTLIVNSQNKILVSKQNTGVVKVLKNGEILQLCPDIVQFNRDIVYG
jgi:hypothetical protein